ncbi:MAG: tail fiber domain-containing protein [Candidatus Saccharibacteria bacterium]
MKPENNPKSNFAANANSGQEKAGNSPTSQNISNELFSSRLIQQSPLSEEVFTNNTASHTSTNSQQAIKQHSAWQRTRWVRMLFYTGVAVLVFLLLLGGWLFFTNKGGSKSSGQFAVTSTDLAGLNTNKVANANGLVIVNGNTQVAGSVTANTFNGSGADLTNLNANNITSGTLNDARLSANVALLNKNQTFTGNNTFTGQVSLPAAVLFGNLLYSFPASQQQGFLTNDGNGNLTWGNASGCITCLNNGGDSFGAPVSMGTNDNYAVSLRTSGANRLTISPTGSAVFTSTVTATQFFGNGAGLTNLDANNITAGTLDSARLPGAVTLQGNTFNGADQLVQLNALGYLPTLNGGNLTSLNASFVTSGTLADARLTANVALLDANQTFIGTNAFTQPITVNTLTPTGAMTIGVTGQNLSLRGNGSTSWTSTTGGFTTTVGFTGVPTGSVTYQFDAAATPGTYTICTTAGGACGGGGSGNVSTPGGTANTIPKFTAANTIGNSNISDNGTTVTIGGTTLVANATELRVNGAAGGYAIDATGDINAGTHLRVGGNIVCDSTGCNASGGGGFYIQNTTSQQSAANFFIQSSSTILPTGVIKQLGGQSSDLLQFQSSGGSTIAEVYTGGGFNTTDKYYVNGLQISSSNLSDGTNLAKLNANQAFTGNNSFTGTISQQNSVDSVHELQIINSGGTTLFNIDSTTNKVAIGSASASWPLDVTGDINSSTGLRINGVLVCDSSGCTSTSSGGINNGTITQVNANYNIQSSDVNAVVGVLKGKAAQVADLFQAQTSAGTPVFKVGQAGLTTINNGITLTGGNQTIQNNTGALNLTASSTTISLNNTTTITSGDGTGLQYAAHYAYQPFSLVDRNYVDNAISSIVIGACPTCFLNGGNTYGTAASLGTNDNYTLTIKTANTPRISIGTNGGVAMQGSTASGNYSTAAGASLASGDYSFAVGGGTASGLESFAGGYNVNPITASGRGSLAFGSSDNGAITAAGVGSFAGGNNASTGTNAHYSIAFGYSATTGTNAIASAAFNSGTATGAYSFAAGCSTASNDEAFSMGYCAFGGVTALVASGRGSFVGGFAQNGTVTAQADGSFAFGDNVAANNVNGTRSVAFGLGSRANATASMAVNAGQTSGDYSFAANYATASGTGASAFGSTLVTSSGGYSFAGGYANVAITSSNNGSFAFGRSGSYTISATGEGSFAIGASRDGAILASGLGSLAGGSNSTASNEFAIAFGNGTQATGAYSAAFNNARATNTGAFATGSGTASGAGSFAGGYISSWAVPITANGLGSFAYGRAPSYALTASGEGSIALGYSRDGAITANGNGSLAGGTNSSTGIGAEFAIAFGTGTQANGAYSAAFNNSIASNTGAFSIGNGTAAGIMSFAGGENGTQAYARRSFAFGSNVKANNSTGEGSIAFGRDTTANGDYSFAFGYGATANAQAAFAIGAGQATGYYSFAGYNATASNSGAFAWGNANTASGQFATVFGQNNTASGNNSVALGNGMTVSGDTSVGINLNGVAPVTLADNNTMALMNGYIGINYLSPSSYSSIMAVNGSGTTYGTTFVNTNTAIRARAGDNSSGTLITFERADGTNVGSITHNGSNTAYNTSSDARLKHDITDTSLGLDTVLQLKVRDFVYNSDTSNTVVTGFIAQELQQLYPEAVSVMDTKTGYLGVDYGKLTPLLAKGIQDINTKVDSLQTEVDQLKNAQTSSNTTTVDVVAELAKASAITIHGNLTVNGRVIVTGNLELTGDNTGSVKIPAGQTRVHLSFTKAFTNIPNVTATPKSLTKASFAVENESINGFDIVIDQAQATDTDFNYHAL